MAKNCGCNNNNDYVYGLFTSDGQFDLDINLLAGVALGATAANYIDPELDKIEFFSKNQMIKEATKIGAGVLLTQFGNKLADGAGYGMVAIGAANIIKSFLPGGAVSGNGQQKKTIEKTIDSNKQQQQQLQQQQQRLEMLLKAMDEKISMFDTDPSRAGRPTEYLYGMDKRTAGSTTDYLYGKMPNIRVT